MTNANEHEECTYTTKYMYRVGESDDPDFPGWLFEVGLGDDQGEVERITTAGMFENEREATIAAKAFLDGLDFKEKDKEGYIEWVH